MAAVAGIPGPGLVADSVQPAVVAVRAPCSDVNQATCCLDDTEAERCLRRIRVGARSRRPASRRKALAPWRFRDSVRFVPIQTRPTPCLGRHTHW